MINKKWSIVYQLNQVMLILATSRWFGVLKVRANEKHVLKMTFFGELDFENLF